MVILILMTGYLLMEEIISEETVNFGMPRIVYSDYNGKILSGDRVYRYFYIFFILKPNASYIIGESSQMEFDPDVLIGPYRK